MPRIIALQPTETTVVDLGYFAWRLGIDATTIQTREGPVPCFSLVTGIPRSSWSRFVRRTG